NDPREIQRLIVSGTTVGQAVIDLTEQVEITSADPQVAIVNSRLEVVPVGDGQTEILVKYDKFPVKVPVVVRNFGDGRRVNFVNEIVPIFTKLSCNSGGCHGKSGGQNGFRLSLLGFEPEEDHDYLV